MCIDPRKVKRAVYNRIDFELPEKVWEELNTAFAICWNEVIGYGNDVYKDTIMDYIVGHLKRKRILLNVNKVDRIVNIILDYLKMTGGFLDDNEKVIPVKPKRDKHGKFLNETAQSKREEIIQRIRTHCVRKELYKPSLTWEELETQIKNNNPQGYHARTKREKNEKPF